MSEPKTKSGNPHAPGPQVPQPPAAATPSGAGTLAHVQAIIRSHRTFRRAHALYQIAQSLVALGTEQAAARATRLYRRALRLVAPESSGVRDMQREELRDAVKLRLQQHGAFGWVRRHRLALALRSAALGLLLAILIALIPSWRHHFFPRDLALGKTWTASSAWPGFAITGSMLEDSVADPMFHTLEELSPSVTLDLDGIKTVRAVQIANRASCCRERVVPMVVELSSDGSTYRRVAYRRDTFNHWTARFEPQSTRFVRLRVERQSILHLRHISVY